MQPDQLTRLSDARAIIGLRANCKPLSFAVVICTYDSSRCKDLELAVESVRCQSYRGRVTTIISVDGNSELYRRISQRYSQAEVRVVTTAKMKPAGLAEARNVAINRRTEDVIAFLDDDATADRDWISSMADSFAKYDCVAVAGKTLPSLKAHIPSWLTPSFYWLIGATGTIERDYTHFVRSGWGSNISYIRDALVKVGMFASSFGKRGRELMQAEEVDLALRVLGAFGKDAVYNPKALIFHKVSQEKLRINYMLRRAYYQGSSKALLFNIHGRRGSTLRAESNFLRLISYESIQNITDILNRVGTMTCLQRLVFSISITFAVGLGFIINIFCRPHIESLISNNRADYDEDSLY